jgi:hypothetical protein
MAKGKTLTRDTDKGGSEDTQVTGRQLDRISGLVLVIGASAFALHVVLRSLIAAGGNSASYAQQGPWLATNALGLLGAVLAAGLWMIVGNLIIAPSGPATNLAINQISNLGPVLLLVPVGYLGYRLWVENAPANQAAPASS